MTKSRNIFEITARSTQYWAGILAILLLAAMLYINFSNQQSAFLQKEFELRNETLITMAASYAAPFLQTKNIISLNLLLKELTSRPEISFGQILNSNGEVLTEVGEIRVKGQRLNLPVDFDSELIGHIRLIVRHNLRNYDLLTTTFISTILIMLAWSLLSVWFMQSNRESWDKLNKLLIPVLETECINPDEWRQNAEGNAKPILNIMSHLKQRMTQDQIELLALDNPNNTSQFRNVVVLHCSPVSINQNVLENQSNTYRLQIWLDQVAHIYHGQRIENGNYIAFGLEEDEAMAVNALCAARVLYFLCQNTMNCAISLSAGEIWTGAGLAPWPVIRAQGRVIDDLKHLHLNNSGELILMTESLFQHADLNNRIIASIFKDLIKSDGHRLEVWQLDGLHGQYDALLRHQADRLPDLC